MLQEAMLEHGLCELIDEQDILARRDGRLLLAGVFAVWHSHVKLRLILDSRPANACERLLTWARFPLGPMLSRFVLKYWMGMKGSGSDFESWFFQLLEQRRRLARRSFGRRVTSARARRFAGVEQLHDRMTAKVPSLGSRNSSVIPQLSRDGILISARAFVEGARLQYGFPIPIGNVLEGFGKDDRGAIGLVNMCDVQKPKRTDRGAWGKGESG
jgi:hypothetical protein